MLKFVFVVIVFIVLMVANHRVAKEKGKNVLVWTAFGIFFPVFAIFLNLVLPDSTEKT